MFIVAFIANAVILAVVCTTAAHFTKKGIDRLSKPKAIRKSRGNT